MSNEGQNLLSIPKFDGDYDHWQMLMENLLRSKEWWHLIDPGYVEPEAGTTETAAQKAAREQLKLKDLKVKNYLFSAIDKNILKTILQKDTSAQLWESMRKKYQGNQRVQRAQLQALRREFEILEMKEGETVSDYISRVMVIVNSMGNNGEILKETQIVEKILRTLTEKFNYIVVSIEESKDITTLTVDELQSSLIVHEQKFKKKFECPEWGKRANFAEMDEDEELLLMAYIESRGASIEEVITNVYYIPELKTNLLSVGQLQEKGLAVLIQNNICKVFHSRRGVIMQAEMSGNRMFYFKAAMASNSLNCYQTRVEDETQLWHSRFGHLHYKALRTLAENGMVEGMPTINNTQEVCSHCLVGKQQRDPIPKKNSWRATKKLQLIHSDICGPISPISNSEKEAFIKFKNFKNLIEKEAGTSIQCLRTDRGGEFTSNEFTAFCDEHGINRQLTAAYTPQQNGVAERKNRTIMNMVRSMLNEKHVLKEYWAEAANWSVHILNRCPTSALDNMTPQEAWSGIKPKVDYFRVFGCLAYVHVPYQKRHKLDEKSKVHVFLGVSKESKAYRFVDLLTNKIVISRDVKFNESKGWEWEETGKGKGKDLLECPDNDIDEVGEETRDPENSSVLGSNTDVDNSPPKTHRRTSERHRRAPVRFSDYVSGNNLSDEEEAAVVVQSEDPLTYDEAVKDKKWREAMLNEMESIKKNKTWELTSLPEGCKAIGYSQQYGIDYKEVFAPVVRLDTIRAILATAAQRNWEVFQLDVKSAFLQGNLEERVFVQQPVGFEVKGAEDKVYKLNKALYGLKQAPRAWYSRIESYFIKEGFKRCSSEHTLFTKEKEGVLERFGMENSNPVGNPIVLGTRISCDREGTKVDSTRFKQLVGSLMYLTATRPDITYGVSLISRYMESPTEKHWCAAKRILRYVQGTTELGILYSRRRNSALVAYSDSDFAGDLDDRRSTSGSVFLLAGGAISWSSKKQPVVTLSTTEAEYIAATACACQCLWLKRILAAIGHEEGESSIIQCDNSSAIQLSMHHVFHGRSKHIDVKFHFLRDLVNDGIVQLTHCNTHDQIADVMTKPLKKEQFVKLRKSMGLVEMSNHQHVKAAFLEFYHDKFKAQTTRVNFGNHSPFKSLSPSERISLEGQVSVDEIREAVWDCGSEKALGPDGFSFLFLKKFWELLKHDIGRFVTDFFATSRMPIGVNSAFITLIPKVPNPVLITDFRPISLIGLQYKIVAKILANRLAKVVHKLRKIKLMVFKIDFEKAYDSVSWKYLDHVLNQFGFGSKWRGWIRECLYSACTSILANGSPTAAFSLKHWLRQGDPLSPFLFILIIEGLHIAIEDAVHQHAYLMEPNEMVNFIGVLDKFYQISGLKINIQKSNVYGFGVSEEEIEAMSLLIGCSPGILPFTYLGIPIGSSMNYTVNWQKVIDKFKARLSTWKANLLSIGGRLTLIKAVLESVGGLGVGSLKAFNLALLQKWRWRFVTQPNMLWVKLLKAIHGKESGLDLKGCSSNSVWAMIVGSLNTLHFSGIVTNDTFKCKVGDGASVRFWKDTWLGDEPLSIRYNRLFRLDSNEECNIPNSWQWMIAKDSIFTVSETQKHIDDIILPSMQVSTRWCKALPRKVNRFMRRLRLDRLPHRLNLSKRGMNINLILCLVCNNGMESNEHLFCSCEVAVNV
ncbi:putative RNA-directed DNA polymerase [Tanacetum coccineum]